MPGWPSAPPPKTSFGFFPPLKTAAVLGAGTMGGGIAWLFSNAGVSVVMKDVNRQAVGGAYAAVHTIYDTLVRIGKIDRREADMKAQKVSGTTDYRGFGRADFIIEAIVEDKKIKTDALAELETFCRPDAIIATNTSSLSVDELARGLEHPERFLGFHFFNPVSRMPLVEVVRGGKTSAGTLARAVRYARELGKTPIVVKDCHGFLVNRILMSYLNEALFLLQEGYDFSKVDRLMLNFGMPMGPFALLDEIGIRVALKVAHILSSAYPERSPGVALAAEMEADKSLGGRQAGRGFYLYEGKKRRPNPAVGNILKRQDIRIVGRFDADEVRERLLLRMINEAALCLEQKIIEKPAYLDLALILGTGFPAFRGGILRYADSLGTGTVLSLTERYAERAGGRFVPGALIRELARKERGFYA
ncbi:MAG: 3-hydroxyacyl-CoA dehydrogenase NAD-binding domain-containing protein [Spirochaetia bacterium]